MDTLYSLSAEYNALLELACSDDPDDEQTFLDTLEGLTGVIESKMDDYAVVMTHLSGRSDLIDKEIKRLQVMKQTIDNHQKRMKEHLLRVMTDTLHETKIKTDLHTFTVCKNGGKQPMEITGEVPDNYKRIVYETDTEKIRADLENGVELPFAHLNERGTHLMIK